MMNKIEIIPIPAVKIVEEGDNLLEILFDSLKKSGQKLENNDFLVIASKVISFSERQIIEYSNVKPSKIAEKLATRSKIAPQFAQIILNECDSNIIGTVPGAITTYSKYGLLANAGADQSNVGEGKAIILPKNVKKSAMIIHRNIKSKIDKYVGIIIADSRATPTRLGTVGCALGTYGFESVSDERGKRDLFERKMHITTRAIADQLATAAELVMGETNERIPFVIIRNYPMKRIEEEKKAFKEKIPSSLNYEHSDFGLCIIVPECKEDIEIEGRRLKHCVGSYIGKVISGRSMIVFLRDLSSPDQSLCTIEISEGKITEAKGNMNRDLCEIMNHNFIRLTEQKMHELKADI